MQIGYMVKALLGQVMQPVRLSPEEVMNVKIDVVGKMDHLIHYSLQCWCSGQV
jgi:hypothetical protein